MVHLKVAERVDPKSFHCKRKTHEVMSLDETYRTICMPFCNISLSSRYAVHFKFIQCGVSLISP